MPPSVEFVGLRPTNSTLDAHVPGMGAAAVRPASFFGGVRAWLEPHVRAGEVCDLPLDLCSALWIGAAQEWSRHWLEDRVDIPLAEARRVLADAAWQALRTDPTRGRHEETP